MFSFLFGDSVDSVALSLKNIIEKTFNEYSLMKFEDLKNSISKNSNVQIELLENKSIVFYFKEMDSFEIFFDEKSNDDYKSHSLSVRGIGNYDGFFLQVSNTGEWHSSAIYREYLPVKVTKRSKKLVKILEEQYGIQDLGAVMERIKSFSNR